MVILTLTNVVTLCLDKCPSSYQALTSCWTLDSKPTFWRSANLQALKQSKYNCDLTPNQTNLIAVVG